MGRTKKATRAQMDLAIHLFEMGFPAESVEVAVERFNNVEDAVVWLTGDVVSDGEAEGAGEVNDEVIDSTPASSAAAVTSAYAPPATLAEERGATNAADADGNPARSSLGRVLAPAADPEERRSLKSAEEPADDKVSHRRHAVMISVPTPVRACALKECAPIEERPIEDRDARDFWREKAGLWQQLIPSLQARAASNLVGGPEFPPSPHGAVASGKRPLPNTEAEQDATELGAAELPPQKSPKCLPVATPSRATRSPVAMTPLSPTAMRFNRVAEACGICMEKTAPCRAVRLCCGHGWYCADCLTGFTEARLSDGLITMPCPEPGCPSELGEAHLRKLLPSRLMEKLLDRRLDLAVSQDPNLRQCPTPNCTMLVELDGTQSRLSCPLCKKTSCFACGAQPYHKGLTCEQHAEKMKNKQSKNDELFEQWLEETGTKRCPRCEAPVSKQCLEKQSGQQRECHKMMCRACSVLFCFKCLAILDCGVRCGCTSDIHGFINPEDGTRVEHRKKRRGRGADETAMAPLPPAPAAASRGGQGRGRGRGRGS